MDIHRQIMQPDRRGPHLQKMAQARDGCDIRSTNRMGLTVAALPVAAPSCVVLLITADVAERDRLGAEVRPQLTLLPRNGCTLLKVRCVKIILRLRRCRGRQLSRGRLRRHGGAVLARVGVGWRWRQAGGGRSKLRAGFIGGRR